MLCDTAKSGPANRRSTSLVVKGPGENAERKIAKHPRPANRGKQLEYVQHPSAVTKDDNPQRARDPGQAAALPPVARAEPITRTTSMLLPAEALAAASAPPGHEDQAVAPKRVKLEAKLVDEQTSPGGAVSSRNLLDINSNTIKS
ncbi:unnamed protein product [Prorocentrum cordatum]|uniref:Uncharacterized protein n=1 Tax=Prorocentrum cordatum TaxID=2364126 RepID=A0ABN9TWP3_9DINO|nr:unnamed protein product [Polarella glacialis]